MAGNLTRAEYLLFQELIERASGLRLADGDRTPLRVALVERTSALGCTSFGEYYDMLRSPASAREVGKLIELLTVHETSFFRNRAHFNALVRTVVPELLSRNSATRALKLWSAGCSTGQEAYSVAMALLESVPALHRWQVEVLATDISQRALEAARRGVYPERAIRGLEPSLLDRYFERCEEGYRVCDRVRRLVRFEHLNLVKEPFPLAAVSPCDVIFCENVTIYFKIESTRRVIRNFYDTLREGGYLFLGYSETLWHISEDFVLRETDGTFVYQKPVRPAAAGEPVAASATPPSASGERASEGRGHGRLVHRRSRTARPIAPRGAASLEEAAALYEERRFEEALLMVESLLSSEPFDAPANLLAAKLRADREETGPALRHCRRALESNPLLEEGHYLMGLLQLRSGESEGAAESLSRVIYLNPGSQGAAMAHFHLAGLYADSFRWASAAREYRNALRLLERLPKDGLVGELSADFLARVCRRRLEEMEVSG